MSVEIANATSKQEFDKSNQMAVDQDSRDWENGLSAVLDKYWGFDGFLPLQLNAMLAVMADRDSLVVFPTGGGKSLCFQAPSLCRDGLGVVVSPLISLMKDQIDGLKACGVPAAFLNSSMSPSDERQVLQQIQDRELRLLYLAPERLLTDRTHQLLASAAVSFFAIDEAHCVSQWGHDFRPEYRGLSVLKNRYPGVAIHAYTATATQQVRDDILKQLGMENATTLIGSMDRPNLSYQIRRRKRGLDQVIEILNKHKKESGIIYCISRKDVEANCAAFNAVGFSALPYHAGMTAEQRNRNQEAFLAEETNIIVATVAFGMGIDKSNVRYVIHASMPKSLEAYQQESGRAGRDGLDAECWLFFNGGDFVTWKRLIERSDSNAGYEGAVQSLNAISQFCNGVKCRHVALAGHFGEQLVSQDCGACDVCLNELDLVEDSLTLAQKIVSCVYRVEQRFGAEYVSQILAGSEDKRILQNGHHKLSTHALLESENRHSIREWIEQLISQGFLARVGEFNVIEITNTGTQLLRGDGDPKLTRPASDSFADSVSEPQSSGSWEGVDQPLFERLSILRGNEAQRRNVPVHIVFGDASLRDMAKRFPSTRESFHLILGVGQQKLDDYGKLFLDAIMDHCQTNRLTMDVKVANSTQSASEKSGPTRSAMIAFPLFEQGLSIAEIAKKLGRAESTTNGYLVDYIRFNKIADASRWVDVETVSAIETAILKVGIGPLKPVFIALNEKIEYDPIRIVMECMQNKK